MQIEVLNRMYRVRLYYHLLFHFGAIISLESLIWVSPQAPHFTDQHPNVYIFKTDVKGNPLDLVLPCSIDSPSPTVQYTWFREGEQIPQNMVDDNGTLVIPNITNGTYASREGVQYHCIATDNLMIDAQQKYLAGVRSRTITVFYAFFNGFARTPEAGGTTIEVPVDVALNSDVALECDVLDASPPPTIKWFNDQGEISVMLQDDSIFFLEDGRYLYMRNLGQAQLQQQYYCVVTNALLDREIPSPTRHILNESLPQGELRTYKDIGNLVAFVGNTSYKFSYIGGVYGRGNTMNPFGIFNGTLNRMFADGAEVAVHGNIGIIDVISLPGTVALRAQVMYDGGIINMLGSLVVNEVPAIISSIQDERVYLIGEMNLVYTCEFTGTPTPTLVFYFNGERISPDRSISIIGNTLMIISPRVNNSGIYQCIVSNEYGDDQLAWLLEVREPLTPILERATVINATTVQLSWIIPSESIEAITGYRIFIATAEQQFNISIGLVTTWLIHDLAPNTTYIFQIAALYGEIEGPSSDFIVAKTDAENQVCEELPLPDRGTIEYSNNLTVGSEAMYINFECEQNYEKSGDLTLKCTESGWEGQPPTCNINTRTAVIIASTLPVVFGILIVVTVIILCIIILYYCMKKKKQRERLTLRAENQGFSDVELQNSREENSPEENYPEENYPEENPSQVMEPHNITQSVTTISDMPHHAQYDITTQGILIHQSAFYHAANTTAQVPFLCHELLECDCRGLDYTNEYHDITLRVPEGAVDFGKKIHLEFAVAMYGPFIFPEYTQPTSPILWLCILEEDVELKKPFRVILPHYLTGLTNEKVQQHHVGFAKAKHRDNLTWLDGKLYYQFQSCDIKSLFARSGHKSYGVLTSKHCCFYCLLANRTPNLAMDAGYMLVCTELALAPQRHEVHFCAIYCLDTCYRSLKEQSEKDGFCISYCHRFKFKPDETAIRMTVHPDDQSLLIGLKPKTAEIKASQIDFWRETLSTMQIMHDSKMYPPRVQMTVGMQTTDFKKVLVKFEGCISDTQLEFDLFFPIGTRNLHLSPTSSSSLFNSMAPQSHRILCDTWQMELEHIDKCLEGILSQLNESSQELPDDVIENPNDVHVATVTPVKGYQRVSELEDRHSESVRNVENLSELENHMCAYSGVISVTNPIYSTNIEFIHEEQTGESVADGTKDIPMVHIETATDLHDIRVSQADVGKLIHQSVFYNAAKKTAQVPFLDHKLLECDCKGLEYTNEYHDITLRVPEGAVDFGKKVHFEFAVVMYGPFIFPENTQPTSPVLWLCILEEDVELKKPFRVILPHYLTGLTNEMVRQHYVSFAKASHNDYTLVDGQMYYRFQLCHDIKPLFAKSGHKSYGVLTSKHCCFYCLQGKQTPKLALDAGYMLIRIESVLAPRQYEIHFCVTYCLDTCYQSVEEQFPEKDGHHISYCREFKFKADETDPHIKMVVHPDDQWLGAVLIGLQPTSAMIRASDVDFWREENITFKKMCLRHKLKMYPPRVHMTVRMKTTDDRKVPVKFEGCTSDSQLNMELTFPIGTRNLLPSPASPSSSLSSDMIPQSHKILCDKQLSTIFKELIGIAEHWKSIGTLLGVPPDKLNAISADQKGVHDRLQEMLHTWLKSDGHHTWENLADAVKEVDPSKAKDIRNRSTDT